MGKYINENKSDSRRKAKTTQMLTDRQGGIITALWAVMEKGGISGDFNLAIDHSNHIS